MKTTRSINELSFCPRPSALIRWNRRCWNICLVAAVASVALVSVAERVTHASPDPPSLTHVFQPATGPQDVQVVAGKDYVFVADASHVVIYEKQSRSNPAGLPFILVQKKELNLPSLFDPLYGPDDPNHPRSNNVNANLGFDWPPKKPGTVPAPIPCFIEYPWDRRQPMWDLNPANISKPDSPDYHTRYLPTSSCISEIYDVRIAYDEVRDVYYIGAAARNFIWTNNDLHPENPDVNRHPAIAAQARRFVFLAVSRPGADPKLESSYVVFPVSDDNADWPLMAVRGDSVLVAHAGGQLVNFYGPGVLAKGGVKLAWSGKWPLATHHSASVLPVRNHAIPTEHQRAEIFFIGLSDSDKSKLAINAAVSDAPGHLVTAIPLSNPFHLLFAGLANTALADAVLSGGRLYVVTLEELPEKPGITWIRYFSVPVSLTSSNKIVVGNSRVISGFISDPTDSKTISEDSPSVEVTRNGDVVVSYRAAGKRATGEVVLLETRYSILYHGEKWFRHYEVLKAGAPGSTRSTLNDIDFAKGWLDPDGLTVWIAGTFATGSGNSAVVGAVTP